MKNTFKQTDSINNKGSFINRIMGNNSTMPEVGKGMTLMRYTDRNAYEVLEVSEDSKQVVVRPYKAISKGSGMGHQDWELVSDENAPQDLIVWRNNAWRKVNYNTCISKENYKTYEAMIDENKYAEAKEFYDSCPLVCQKQYDKVNVLWGRAEKYYDWEF